MRRLLQTTSIILASTAVAAGLGACGSNNDAGATAGPDGVTLYNAQSEELMKTLVTSFTKQTGIKVAMRNGEDLEMANQIAQEGDRSPADVFVTENSPAMSLIARRGLLAPVSATTKAQVPARYRPRDGSWTGFAARQTAFVFNTSKPVAQALPASILDLAKPEWEGRVGYAPTGADFQAIVSAVLALEGRDRTTAWLKGLKQNAVAYQGNTKVMAAVNKGDIEGGVIFHYYWYQDQAEAAADSKNTKLHFFGAGDPGAFTSVSGAGVLKRTDNPAGAQKFVEFLTGRTAQRLLAASNALEYSIASGVPANRALPPLAGLDAPVVDLGALNSKEVVTMMQDAGII